MEWKIPENVTGTDQARGNSGVFLASTGGGDAGYELQILDSYNNKTYVNGQAGSIYKQGIPLVNPVRKPGEWQSYDVIWMAPVFNADGISEDTGLCDGIHERRAGAEPLRIEGRDVIHRKAVLQEVRFRAHQVAGPSRSQRTGQLSKHLGERAELTGPRKFAYLSRPLQKFTNVFLERSGFYYEA